jgi:hypothetical protein
MPLLELPEKLISPATQEAIRALPQFLPVIELLRWASPSMRSSCQMVIES